MISKDVSLLHKYYYTCDAHFDVKDYYVLNGKKILRKGAVPTLCGPTPLSDESLQVCRQSNQDEAGKSCMFYLNYNECLIC